jgi:predicted enzyme related to lactoylglutathione lyase
MDHLSNWIEIPVADMKRAKRFYGELLGVALNGMQMGSNDYALFEVKDRFNTGCLVKGKGYVPSKQGVVVYLNGGDDLSTVLARVAKAGGKVLLEKTFLSKEAGHIAYFVDTEGNKIGLHSMA